MHDAGHVETPTVYKRPRPFANCMKDVRYCKRLRQYANRFGCVVASRLRAQTDPLKRNQTFVVGMAGHSLLDGLLRTGIAVYAYIYIYQ